MKSFLIVLFLSFLNLNLLCFGLNEDSSIPVVDENGQVNTIQTNQRRDIKVNDLDIEPMNTQSVKKTVIPDTKQEGKKVLNLFLKAMMIVALCSLFCFIVLKFIRKFYASAFVNQQQDDYEALDLSGPNTKQEALQSFLRRTK